MTLILPSDPPVVVGLDGVAFTDTVIPAQGLLFPPPASPPLLQEKTKTRRDDA